MVLGSLKAEPARLGRVSPSEAGRENRCCRDEEEDERQHSDPTFREAYRGVLIARVNKATDGLANGFGSAARVFGQEASRIDTVVYPVTAATDQEAPPVSDETDERGKRQQRNRDAFERLMKLLNLVDREHAESNGQGKDSDQPRVYASMLDTIASL